MHTIDAIQERLNAADDTAAVLAAGSEAFELIDRVCTAYAGNARESYAMWMSAIPLAGEGMDELAHWHPPIPPPEQIDPSTVSENNTADQLAALADRLGTRLRDAAHSTASQDEQQACHQAAVSADQIRALLAVDG